MQKILIVDDDEPMRRLMRLSLVDEYEILDTAEPEQALALALEHKPDVILLDLRMPGYSGFDLCSTFTSSAATKFIPVFIISGEAGAKTRYACQLLGAAAYFEKPVNFDALRASLKDLLKTRRHERRAEIRVGLKLPIRLSGQDVKGRSFEILTNTENISKNGFLCACAITLEAGTIVNVDLQGIPPQRMFSARDNLGKARIVHCQTTDPQLPRYGCVFTEKIAAWSLQ